MYLEKKETRNGQCRECDHLPVVVKTSRVSRIATEKETMIREILTLNLQSELDRGCCYNKVRYE